MTSNGISLYDFQGRSDPTEMAFLQIRKVALELEFVGHCKPMWRCREDFISFIRPSFSAFSELPKKINFSSYDCVDLQLRGDSVTWNIEVRNAWKTSFSMFLWSFSHVDQFGLPLLTLQTLDWFVVVVAFDILLAGNAAYSRGGCVLEFYWSDCLIVTRRETTRCSIRQRSL